MGKQMKQKNVDLKRGELAMYAREGDWRRLPPIHGYWCQSFLAPKMRAVFGCEGVVEFFAQGVAYTHEPSAPLRVLSVGSGLCQNEQKIAVRLQALGYDVHVECLEMSPERVATASDRFRQEGVERIISVTEQDINEWQPGRIYDAIMANHALHHFVELERLFDTCLACLTDAGRFLTNDMIGRNGHRRWPEVLAVLQSIWDTMPRKYKYNHPFGRFDDTYDDWDYSKRSFEGIRAQDIMPLLNERFDATHFAAEAGLIDPFIDRKYGHNFSRESAEDTAFIRQVGSMNEVLIDAGTTKPTLALGWFRKKTKRPPKQRCYRHWTAEFCTREPG